MSDKIILKQNIKETTKYYNRDYNRITPNKFIYAEIDYPNEVWTPIIVTLYNREGILKIINILGVEANPPSNHIKYPSVKRFYKVLLKKKLLLHVIPQIKLKNSEDIGL